MQRASLSLLRSAIGGSAQLEVPLQRTLAASFSTSGSFGPSSSSATPSPAVRPSLLASLGSTGLCSPQGVRFHGDLKPEVRGDAVGNWSEMRASFNKERPSSLGGSYYSNVLVMGFAYWLNEAYYFPPRTLYIGALVFLLLYVRKAFFSTPMAFKHEY
ncbi:hypothetical protein TSOC_012160 [Tetrabaena socialis]|uniref:Uncharacterized protein n=1 Tax=Tetrabaena socialis TaxID=47790 RepID=A0A2J7ZNS8_9CHLO|nr:hypothetical protein TSOC_012160 [Tetrabaena socialis]|eukprot:PNH01908.1 hypothetical protein TSOC_012160 [Tetrabaena socialis]